MRIVQIVHTRRYGGAELHCRALISGLLARGHEVIFAGPQDSWLTRECQALGVQTFHLRMAGMYDLLSFWRLHGLVRQWRPHIVHGHLLRGARYAASVSAHAATVCTAHLTDACKHMRGCHHIVAVAEAIRTPLLAVGYPAEQITVIPNGMPDAPRADSRERLREALGIAPDEFALVNAGRFAIEKGQDVLVQMMQHLPECTLYLVGDYTTEFGQTVKAMAASNPRIRFLGYRADVARLLCAFDVYVCGSRREALPLAFIEASAAGLPLVSTDVGGVREVIKPEHNGLVVPAGNAEALATAIERLRHDVLLRTRLAVAARDRYLRDFTLEQMVKRTEALYETLVHRR